MRNLFIICLAVLAVCFAPNTRAAESAPVKSGRVTAQLVTTHDTVAPGQDLQIALSLRLEPKWHTYWRNAGGPGNPAAVYWDLPNGVSVGEMTWPLPKLVSTGPLINYAFEDKLLLPMPLHISKDARPGDVLPIKAEATYLVCHIVCLPEQANLELDLTVGAPLKDGRWSANISRTLRHAPKDEGLVASASLNKGKLDIMVSGDRLVPTDIKDPYFFPYEQDVIEARDKQKVEQTEDGVRFTLSPSFGLQDGIKDVPGVMAFGEKIDGEWVRRGIVLNAVARTSENNGGVSANTDGPQPKTIGLLAALIGAFLGGLILNLMPCVFPVISLKALGFARAAHEDKRVIRQHGLLYGAGAVLSFIILALGILAIKASGASVGWGFQLQNPVIVGGLALLFFAIALNLFGVFEIGGRFQNTGATLANAGGSKGAFFTGVLAVIVATPCTAPFMGTALFFAFAQPAPVTLLVFLALGFGFALPFVALSFAPGLLAKLPKPGPWMETFKQALAFPMMAAAIWLVWVLSVQTGAGGVWRILAVFLLCACAIWLWRFKTILAKILVAGSVLYGGYLLFDLSVAQREQALAAVPESNVWSPERVTELRAEGKTVFVDFTAAWCVSCKANEIAVLDTAKTRDLFTRTNTVKLIADWTRRDDNITAELSRHGRSGVPLYLVYPAGTDDVTPQILPQILTYSIVENAVKQN